MRFKALERAFCKCSWLTPLPISKNLAACPGWARRNSSGVMCRQLLCKGSARRSLRMKEEARRYGSSISAGFLPDRIFGLLAISRERSLPYASWISRRCGSGMAIMTRISELKNLLVDYRRARRQRPMRSIEFLYPVRVAVFTFQCVRANCRDPVGQL